MNLFKAACVALVIAAVAAGFLVYPSLPARVPTHWNAAGEVDAYGPSWVGALLLPLVMAFVLLLFALIPKIAVFKENFGAFEKQYWALGLIILLFFALFYAITLAPNYGFQANVSQPLVLLAAMLFIAVGILMPSFKRNFFVGIRTPWTLANDIVWEKTHRLGGKLFIAAGVISLTGLLALGFSITLLIGAVLAAAAISVVYSFLAFRKTGKRQL